MAVAGTASGLLRMMRPGNALLAALAVLVGMLLSVGPADQPCDPEAACPVAGVPGLVFPAVFAAPAAALLLTAFGNVLNDVRDVAIDRQAHPRRPLVQGLVRPRVAMRAMMLLLSLGLACALLAGVWPFAFAVGVVITLLAYETVLKARGLPGNLAVAALAASTFLFGAVAQGPLANARFAAIAAGMAFFVNVAREVAKDMADMEADRPHRRTFPHRVGAPAAAILVALAAITGIAVSTLFVAGHLGCLPAQDLILLAVLVGGADLAVGAGGFVALRSPLWAHRLLKAGMAVAMVAFFFVTPASSFCP